jgi:hypothetical protein
MFGANFQPRGQVHWKLPRVLIHAGFELSKNKWGVDILPIHCHAITHRRFSIINNGGGLKLTPQGIPGHHVWGVRQTTGGFNPQPPGNSNTGYTCADNWSN